MVVTLIFKDNSFADLSGWFSGTAWTAIGTRSKTHHYMIDCECKDSMKLLDAGTANLSERRSDSDYQVLCLAKACAAHDPSVAACAL